MPNGQVVSTFGSANGKDRAFLMFHLENYTELWEP